MNIKQAADYYKTTLSSVNQSIDRLNTATNSLDLDLIRPAAEEARETTQTAVERLDHPPTPWPKVIEADMRTVRDIYSMLAESYTQLAEATTTADVMTILTQGYGAVADNMPALVTAGTKILNTLHLTAKELA